MLDTAKHAAGFLIAGAIATAADAAVLTALTRLFGIDPFLARVPAIGLAIVAGYFAHRHWTFAVKEPPSLREFLKFTGVAIGTAAINYAVYAGLLLARPSLAPLAAMLIATAVAMSASYLGYRFGVFRKPTP